jgi:hypothetical protein
LNVIFNIFTKVISNRTILVADKMISPIQTSFIQGRYILDGVVLLHETLHELKVRKTTAVVFKVDFEKAYDKIEKPFLEKVLLTKGFPTLFVKSIMAHC